MRRKHSAPASRPRVILFRIVLRTRRGTCYRMAAVWDQLRDRFDEWCTDKIWWWRLGLLAAFAFEALRYFRDPEYSSVFDGITFGIHELGHMLWGFLGEWMSVAGGSLTQVLAPIASMLMFLKQPDFFAISICGYWLATSLINVSRYIGDAFWMRLPLVSPGGGETYHDWNYLLDSLGMLSWHAGLARLTKAMGFLMLFASFAFGLWVIVQIYRRASQTAE